MDMKMKMKMSKLQSMVYESTNKIEKETKVNTKYSWVTRATCRWIICKDLLQMGDYLSFSLSLLFEVLGYSCPLYTVVCHAAECGIGTKREHWTRLQFNLEPGLFFLIWGVCLGFAVITTHLFDVIVVLLRLLFVALRLLLKKGLKATSTSIYGYGYDIRFR